jgi:hypothetical protein
MGAWQAVSDGSCSPQIFLINAGIVRAVNGNDPHNMAYNNTPKLHTSTNGPLYSRPVNTSGAAYCACYIAYHIHTTYYV